MNNLNDSDLVSLISQGNQPAFNLLMKRHLATVLVFCKQYLPQDAEDIAQEVFIRLWNYASKWQDKGFSVKAWLFRVSYHLCIDELRKNKLVYLEESPEVLTDNFDNLTETLHDARLDLQQQSQALKALPEKQRSAIMLCSCNGLNHKEAAQVLNISVDALEALLARGRRKLKQLFDKATG